MANEDEIDKPTYKLLALVIAGILAGTGGSLSYRVIDNPRPDPFTGTHARELEAKILNKIERIEERIRTHDKEAEMWKLQIQSNKDRIEYHFRNHP